MPGRVRAGHNRDPVAAVIAWVALALVADGAAALVGALLPERWLARYRPALLGFATGVLLGTCAFELFPAAFEQASQTRVLVAVGASFAAMGAIELAMGRIQGPAKDETRISWMLLGADAFHNAADGAAIAAAFLISTRLGCFTAAAVIVHELPEELADYVLLRAAAVERGRALLALAAVQLTSVIGAALTLAAAQTWNQVSGLALSVGTGTFLYISFVDFGPILIRGDVRRAQAIAGLLIGLVLTGTEVFL
jgi:zinc and cadmium transporter